MKNLYLKRFAFNDDATFGVFIDENDPFCLTVERPWLNNQKGISCIPEGTYTCKRVTSPKFGNTFEVTGVAGRDEILIHTGNVSDDSHGCIIVGHGLEKFNNKEGLDNSKYEFSEFLKRVDGLDQFMLAIKNV